MHSKHSSEPTRQLTPAVREELSLQTDANARFASAERIKQELAESHTSDVFEWIICRHTKHRVVREFFATCSLGGVFFLLCWGIAIIFPQVALYINVAMLLLFGIPYMGKRFTGKTNDSINLFSDKYPDEWPEGIHDCSLAESDGLLGRHIAETSSVIAGLVLFFIAAPGSPVDSQFDQEQSVTFLGSLAILFNILADLVSLGTCEVLGLRISAPTPVGLGARFAVALLKSSVGVVLIVYGVALFSGIAGKYWRYPELTPIFRYSGSVLDVSSRCSKMAGKSSDFVLILIGKVSRIYVTEPTENDMWLSKSFDNVSGFRDDDFLNSKLRMREEFDGLFKITLAELETAQNKIGREDADEMLENACKDLGLPAPPRVDT